MILNTRIVAVLGIGVLAFFLGMPCVFAHAQLVRSNPPDKAELKQAPTRVELWFNELLEDGFNSAEGFAVNEFHNDGRANLTKGAPKVDTQDRTHLIIELAPLKPGKYVIQYRVFSRDGHTAPGQLTFQVLESKQ